VREHVVHQMRGGVGHAAAAARRAEPAALAGGGDERILAAARAVDPGEAVGEDLAAEKGEQLSRASIRRRGMFVCR
jgi:hypothetical protein